MDSRGGRTGIIVFARLPVPGRVKTRLAAGAGVGPRGACDFYRACAEHAIHQAASCCDWAESYVYHSSTDSTRGVEAWLATEGLLLPCVPQLAAGSGSSAAIDPTERVGGAGSCASTSAATSTTSPERPVHPPEPQPDLGAKMLAAMADAMTRHGHRQVIIMGTDIPDITAQLLRRAADALDEHEMVIGPSLDGGYYMMGLTRLEPGLFKDMRWSTETVLQETLSRAAIAGLRVAPVDTLPCLRDVDTVQDLAEWVQSCRDEKIPPASGSTPRTDLSSRPPTPSHIQTPVQQPPPPPSHTQSPSQVQAPEQPPPPPQRRSPLAPPVVAIPVVPTQTQPPMPDQPGAIAPLHLGFRCEGAISNQGLVQVLPERGLHGGDAPEEEPFPQGRTSLQQRRTKLLGVSRRVLELAARATG